MTAVELMGNTLGQKRDSFNKLVFEYISTNKDFDNNDDLNTGENDIMHLLAIDIASNKRDVEYILKVLKCEDMLYISRVLKLCKWIITDPQYSNIVNPIYLHQELLPHMMGIAGQKFMLQIRLNLKEESRVEEFYNYYKSRDVKIALKWLQKCSVKHIEQEVQDLHEDISVDLLKRLSKKSISILEKHMQIFGDSIQEKLNLTKFFINTNPDRYLDVLESLTSTHRPSLGSKYTNRIMKMCPYRIINKFEDYADIVHVDTFAKRLHEMGKTDEFFTKYRDSIKLKRWFTFHKLKYFMKYLPEEEKFKFLKKMYIDRTSYMVDITLQPYRNFPPCYMASSTDTTNTFCWYNFSSFDIAFRDLTPLLEFETSPSRRVDILTVLIHRAKQNRVDLNTLLQYYCDTFMNEPFKFKIKFVNVFLTHCNTHKFNAATWARLNNIFHSLEVYVESKCNVTYCIQAIIVYNILNNRDVPAIVEKKFQFNSLKFVKNNISKEEGDKIFSFLYNCLFSKINSVQLNSLNEFSQVLELMKELETLLKDWDRECGYYPWILNKIKELVKITDTTPAWKTTLASWYIKNKHWKRNMFEESLQLAPSDKTCYNALKHDPGLFSRCKRETECLRRDNMFLRRTLRILRVYWPQSLALEWKEADVANLNHNDRHKATVRGICTLLPPQELTNIINNYAPDDTVDWKHENKITFNLRKQIACNVDLCRPLFPVESILLYTRNEYVQYAKNSILSIMLNKNINECKHTIKLLINEPELQKIGIYLAYCKLKTTEVEEIINDVWQQADNKWFLRDILFKRTFNLLCKETCPDAVFDIWKLMSIMISSITSREKKTVYENLQNIDNVPILVRGQFLQKSYDSLISVSQHRNCEEIIDNLLSFMVYNMHHLDTEFIEKLILEYTENYFNDKIFKDVYTHIMATYLLCGNDKKVQCLKFNRVLLPFLTQSCERWDEIIEDDKTFGSVVLLILERLASHFQMHVFEKRMIFPTGLFTGILNLIETKLKPAVNYVALRTWKIMATYVNLLEKHKEELKNIPSSKNTGFAEQLDYGYPHSINKWNGIYKKALPELSAICLKYLDEDIERYFSSIYVLFSEALKQLFLFINNVVFYEFLDLLLRENPRIEAYLVVLEIVPVCPTYHTEEVTSLIQSIRNQTYSCPFVEVKMHYFKKYKNHNKKNL